MEHSEQIYHRTHTHRVFRRTSRKSNMNMSSIVTVSSTQMASGHHRQTWEMLRASDPDLSEWSSKTT